MLRGFGRDEYEAEEERRETEITLGPVMLLALGLGLILLCAMFFGIGYSVGRRSGPQAAVSQNASGQTASASAAGALSKPSASGTIQAAPAQTTVPDPPQAAPADGGSATNPLTSYAPMGGTSAAPAAQTQVKPAMPQQEAAQPQANSAAGENKVQPAMQQAPQGIMVQVAAVSHQEDATVLVSALRRHGYAATERRSAGDNLIHVQIGPFNDRNDANAMCQRLLGDGYNANIVQ